MARALCNNGLVALGASQASGAELPMVRVGYGGIAGYQLSLWVNVES